MKHIVIPKHVEIIGLASVSLILISNVSTEKENILLENRKAMLRKMTDFIDTNLNPSTRNDTDPLKGDYGMSQLLKAPLEQLGIFKTDYVRAFSISHIDDFPIYLKRPTNSCFVNDSFYSFLMVCCRC